MRGIIILAMITILPLACGNKSTNNYNNGITVSVSPRRQVVALDSTQLFTATVSGTSDHRVTWALNGDSTYGVISSLGLYQAPHLEPAHTDSIEVTAHSVADLSGIGTAWVFLHDPSIFYVSPSGRDDSLGIGSFDHPFRTISHALNLAANPLYAGVQTVKILAGTYDIAHDETFPLVPRSGLILRGAGIDSTFIVGPGGNAPANVVIKLDGSIGITIDSLHIATSDSNGIGIWIRGFISDIGVEHSHITGCNIGIMADSTRAPVIEENRITGDSIGISMNGMSGPYIRGCSISNCYKCGIEILDHALPDLGTRDTSFYAGNNTINFGQLAPQGRWLIYNLHPYLPGVDTIWAVHNTWQSQNLDDNYQYIYDHRRDTTVCAVMLSRP